MFNELISEMLIQLTKFIGRVKKNVCVICRGSAIVNRSISWMMQK